MLASTLMSRYFRPDLHRVIRPGTPRKVLSLSLCECVAVSTAHARAHARTHGRARRSHGPVGTPGAPRGRGRSARTPVSARACVVGVLCERVANSSQINGTRLHAEMQSQRNKQRHTGPRVHKADGKWHGEGVCVFLKRARGEVVGWCVVVRRVLW